MMFTNQRYAIPVAALLAAAGTPALAQYQPQYPVITPQAPATQAAVTNLDNRIVALEQQLAQFLRQSEENAHRLSQIESELKQVREAQQQQVAALEQRAATTVSATPVEAAVEPAVEKPKAAVATADSKAKPIAAIASSEGDAAEQAYDAGYQLWKSGKYEEAIGALRAFTSAYPNHRRVSWANNLAGRAMLDKGEPRAAAEALLANYRSNPKGERAADSLYYLGQALFELGQPNQACKAYGELEAVYGSSMRADLKKLLQPAKSKAKCG
jgi:TolA-binding protein